jgi:acetyl-CoA carboxylase carboxyl transferase subunit alpha
VISPESCSSILWRSWDFKENAAEQLKLTANDMLGNGMIDGIIKEPVGGAHTDPDSMVATLSKHLIKSIKELAKLSKEELIAKRIEKFSKIGAFTEA